MLVITTPTGNTGRYVLQSALEQGESVRVFVRDPSRLDALTHERCEVVQGDLRNPSDLMRALNGAEGVFSVCRSHPIQKISVLITILSPIHLPKQ